MAVVEENGTLDKGLSLVSAHGRSSAKNRRLLSIAPVAAVGKQHRRVPAGGPGPAAPGTAGSTAHRVGA